MTPVLAIVGRPNVGKSTLFNQLTRSRRALVADLPGLTRDRQYGIAMIEGRAVTVVDTGGLTDVTGSIDEHMAAQTEAAISEADAVLVLVDARAGLNTEDQAVIERLRRAGKRFRLVANKVDGLDEDIALGDFHGLTAESPLPISATHRRGLQALGAAVAEMLPPIVPVAVDDPAADARSDEIRVAIVGRPNVGKSTLVNRLLGEERMVTFDEPGTTRDAVSIPFERKGKRFTLIDTAGLRRRARVHETVEKFSAIKTLDAVRAAHVVILVLDAHQGLTEQDQHLVGHVLDAGRALILAINKWDGLDADQREVVRRAHDRRFGFVEFAETRYISALHGTGVGHLFDAVVGAHAAAGRNLSTGELTRALERAVEAHPPPASRGGRIKMRYAHQGGSFPPRIIIHGNRVSAVPAGYRRYLVNRFRKVFQLGGTPIELEFRSGDNPWAGQKKRARARSRK